MNFVETYVGSIGIPPPGKSPEGATQGQKAHTALAEQTRQRQMQAPAGEPSKISLPSSRSLAEGCQASQTMDLAMNCQEVEAGRNPEVVAL